MRGRRVPAWVTDGWYANNPEKQRFAISRFQQPVTTDAERAAAKVPVVAAPTFACSRCNRFAFSKPTTCYWCVRGRS